MISPRDPSRDDRRGHRKMFIAIIGFMGTVIAAGLAFAGAIIHADPPIVSDVISTFRGASPTCSNPQQLSLVPARRIRVTASSTHAVEAKYDYLASNVLDGDPATAWVEGVPRQDGDFTSASLGVGQSLRFSFRGKAPDIEMVCVLNGYGKSWTTYRSNSFANRLSLSTQRGKRYTSLGVKTEANLDDYQALDLSSGTSSFATLTIEGATKGVFDSDGDTAVSEVEFFTK